MLRKLVGHSSDPASVERLNALYRETSIPAEKKPFLISLRDSAGPFMVTGNGRAVLDIASQIASLGMGFNPGVLFGAAQFQESWSGDTDTPVMAAVREALRDLLRRRLDWPDLTMHLCHSGAEANELALGMCFESRRNHSARKVLAFRGAFHGRMTVALQATWNPAKREPFEWPGYAAHFVDYPEMEQGDEPADVPPPRGWQALWANAPRSDFESMLHAASSDSDGLLESELDSLLAVRTALRSGDIFAVIIEPMQCEGGDRYSSSRFHNGLVNLCRAFGVPLIYDEIQTGFALGGEFFWHRKFDLRDPWGQSTGPDFVTIAKKAQLGGVLSRRVSPFREEYQAISLIRGFINASMVDQFREEIDTIEARNRDELTKLATEFSPFITRPRASGLAFAFDLPDSDTLKLLVEKRFDHGLLFYPAGARSARFRLSLAFRKRWLDMAWQQLRDTLRAVLLPNQVETTEKPTAEVKLPDVASYYAFHETFLEGKVADLHAAGDDVEKDSEDAKAFLKDGLTESGHPELEVTFLNEGNWSQFREAVAQLQIEIYEPLRRTPIEKFDRLIAAENALAIVVTDGARIVAMAFGAPPIHFPRERGLRSDDHFEDPLALYMLDLTVIPEFRGRLGRLMKQAVCLLAQARGMRCIVGRNRDRLARGMWAINLSLGSHQTRLIREDYQDEHAYRDCLMYETGLQWQSRLPNLSRGVTHPLDLVELTMDFVREALPCAVNKLTLSNFVTPGFATDLEDVFKLVPDPLRRGYTGSSVAECTDKIVRAIWLQRRPRTRIVAIGEADFGEGSFLSRAISGTQSEFYPVDRIRVENADKAIDELHTSLQNDDVLAVFAEPLGWRNGRRIAESTLAALAAVCRSASVPLVFHESGGAFYRYAAEAFLPSGGVDCLPDAGVLSLGGQMAIGYLAEPLFDGTPLQFISTWDGDAFSLTRFAHSARLAAEQRDQNEAHLRDLDRCLKAALAENGVGDYDLNRGIGWFRGPVEWSLSRHFDSAGDGAMISLPSPGAVRRFLAERGATLVS